MCFLILSNILLWFGVLKSFSEDYTIIACDVGQGDALLVQKKNIQMLVDGGIGSKVLDCLSEYMPFWDTTIELVVLTHPQQDHYEGLIGVIDNYEIENLLATEIDNEAIGYQEFKELVISKQINVISPREKTKIAFADATIHIVHPDIPLFENDKTNVLGAFSTSRDPNDYSISFIFDINEIEIFFTGDIGPEIIEDLKDDGQLVDVDILKVPHHGSKNGLTDTLLFYTKPEIAIISAGANNRFGHPHSEVLDLLEKYNVEVFRTDMHRDIIFKTDGRSVYK